MRLGLQLGYDDPGFWVGLATLPRSHPFTIRRLETLYRLGLFRPRAGPSVGAQA